MRLVLFATSLIASFALAGCPDDDTQGTADTAVTDTSTIEVSPPCSPVDCNDNVACTRDYCVQGTCVHASDDSLCEGGAICNPETGCFTPPETPRCASVDDPICDDGQACTSDKCNTDTGKCEYTPDDTKCADASACDGAERCAPFVGCVDGQPLACDDEVDCTVDTCDDAEGGCVNTPNDQLCQDGVFCDGEEICHKDLGCRENPVVPSCDDGIACTIDRCELPPIDACTHTADQGECASGEICRPDVGCFELPQCSKAGDVRCDDGQACTTDSCDLETGTCRNVPNHAACGNGQFCDGAEQCAPFVGCVPGPRPTCNDGVGCTDDFCDEANDRCGVTLDHAACADGVFCDGDEQCTAAGCVEGAQRSCDDGIGCTVDSCEGGGCVHRTDHSICGAGAICDPLDGGCITTQRCSTIDDPICDDGQACTTDSCNLVTGKCVYEVNDGACDDHQFCNGKEVCAPFRGCLFASFPACDDGVACTTDTCHEDTDTCSNVAQDGYCSNGAFCDGAETCDATQGCKPPTSAPTCDDDLECTVDWCDATLNACVHFANDQDGDLELDVSCGGTDCDNADPDIGKNKVEVCDYKDNDCDGVTDDGVRSTCDNCDPTCNASTPGGDPEDPNGGYDPAGFVSVEFSEEAGGLIIQTQTTLTVNHLWIPNTAESTLSKWDATTATEIGRYKVGLAEYECPGYCCWDAPCNLPSRVVVDGRGDAYVANRGFGAQGTVTKVISDLDRCVDKNSNGTIETSNSNVPLNWDTDECVAWTAAAGVPGNTLRALAIDTGDSSRPEGYPWVGAYHANKFWKMDPVTGSVLLEVDTPVRAYGAVVLQNGILWIGTIDEGAIASIDTKTGVVGPRVDYPGFRGCGTTYGITADKEGRLWMSGWDCQDALGYDTKTGKWTHLNLRSWGMNTGRGITVDTTGKVWMAVGGDGESHITSWDSTIFRPDESFDPGLTLTKLPNGAFGPSGVGIDIDANVWVAHHITSQLVKYNPATGSMDVYTGPNRVYTYSDFTGAVRRTVIARGSYVHEIDAGCADPDWTALTWDASVPSGASVEFVMKSAPLLSQVQAAPEVSMGTVTPADIDAKFEEANADADRHMRVIVNLTGNEDGSSPVLRSFRVDWFCPAPE